MLKQKDNKVNNYSLRSSPMIKGKVVDLKRAISEIIRILKTSSSIHIDGMDCDISSIDNMDSIPEPTEEQLTELDTIAPYEIKPSIFKVFIGRIK